MSGGRGRRALAALALALLPGCGLATLTHDTMLGPVSPLGPIHDVSVGSDFRVTESGPVADTAGEPLLRPYPADFIERLGSPRSFYSLAQGIQAFIASFSFVVQRETREAELPVREGLREGLDAADVLRLLGPPELWIRGPSRTLMLYRGRGRRSIGFYVGVPPLASVFLPVPGLGNLRFRYANSEDRVEKMLLFFGADDVLESIALSKAEP